MCSHIFYAISLVTLRHSCGTYYDNVMAYQPGVAKEPGTKYTEKRTGIRLISTVRGDLNYAIDAEGRITEITYTELWVEEEDTYYYVVLNELLYWEEGVPYYRAEMYDSETKELDRAEATFTYRFEYK